jgi:hypothetical protein
MSIAVMENKNIKSNSDGVGSFKLLAAGGGICGGFLLMLAGLILSALARFMQINFHHWEVFLLIAAFVFIGFGSHCLDLIEKEKSANKS